MTWLDSGAARSLASSGYNARRAECEAAARALCEEVRTLGVTAAMYRADLAELGRVGCPHHEADLALEGGPLHIARPARKERLPAFAALGVQGVARGLASCRAAGT